MPRRTNSILACASNSAQAAWEVVGSSEVIIPGGVPEPQESGTEGCGHWAWRGGVGLGVRILEVFSSLNTALWLNGRDLEISL